MLDIGFSELMLVGLAAVLLLDPKDVPAAARSAKKWMQKLQGYSREASSFMNEITAESGVSEMKKEASAVKQVLDDQGKAYIAYDLDDVEPYLQKPSKTEIKKTDDVTTS